MHKWNKILIGFFISWLLMLGLAQADLLEIQGVQRLEQVTADESSAQLSFKSSVSDKNLLGLSRSGKSLLPDHNLSQNSEIVIKLCAIRVQFEYEETDHDSTTGRGHFDFRDKETFMAEERHGVDPAPHNRQYFDKHLEALNNYWSTVSDGRVEIQGTVFPAQSDSVYTLSNSMSHYGSQPPADGLGHFFHDAIAQADLDDDIDWKTYDVFVIFHAGSDRQSDLGFPLTPHNFFTGFIILGEGAPAANDSVLIMEGMIVPETVSQDNRANAMNAVMAHEFGHQLGLVDLYDTRTFTTFVGDFSLMDNNGFGVGVDLGFELTRTILGTIPIYPDAWSRAYLGFEEMIEIDGEINFPLLAAEVSSAGNKIYKVSISEHEYFLIENRQVDFDQFPGSNLKADIDTAGGNVPTGVILGPAPGDGWDPNMPAPITGEYDFLMPGSGMVIWHVDESVAWLDYDNDGVNNFKDNDLQWFNFNSDVVKWENHPFLRLVEADGIIDFGGEYYVNYGRQADFFYANGNNHFGLNTNPSTRSNSGGYTGIDIYDITGNDTLMFFDYIQNLRTEGWPHHTDSSTFAPVLYDLESDGSNEVFVTGRTYVMGFRAEGDFIFPPVAGSEIISARIGVPPGPLAQHYYLDTLRVIASIGSGRFTTPPTIADLDGDGVAEMMLGTSLGELLLLTMKDDNQDGYADYLAFRKLSNYPIISQIVVCEADSESDGLEIIAGSGDGGVYVLGADGATLQQTIGYNNIIQFSISADYEYAYALNYIDEGENRNYFVHDIKQPSKFKFITGEIIGFSAGLIDTTDQVWITTVSSAGVVSAFADNGDSFGAYFENNPIDLNRMVSSVPTLFPANAGSGRSQIAFAGDNQLYVLNLNGTPIDNFPQIVDLHTPTGEITSSPIVVDLTEDGIPEFIVGTSAGEIFILKHDGTVINKSPLSAPGGISTSLAYSENIGRLGHDGFLYAVTDDGLIYNFTLASDRQTDQPFYVQAGGGSNHRNFQDYPLLRQSAGSEFLASYYNYPNPAREYTNIRFEPDEDADVNIRIYDLSGRLVYERDMEALGGVANEHRWNLENYPSGVYYCRLQVNGTSRSDVQLWNIAVVK